MIRRLGRTAFVLAVAVLTAVRGAEAQEGDAQVLSRGQVRLSVAGENLHLGSEFTAGAARPLGFGFLGPLDIATFAPLGGLGTELEAFFSGTPGGAFPVGPTDLVLGQASVDFSWNTRTVPVRLSVGVLPRVEIGVRIHGYRNERLARRFDIGGGLLGANPAPAANANLLAAIDQGFAELGRAPVLPIQQSTLGLELQRRTFQETGELLALPEAPVGFVELRDAYGVGRPAYMLSEWYRGDLELDARVEVHRSFSSEYYPADGSAVDYRVALGAAIRLPTGDQPLESPAFAWSPEVGHGGIHADAVADLFIGNRVWISGGGAFARISPADTRIAVFPGSPFTPGEGEITHARRDPGDESKLWLLPRFRVTREISLGATAVFTRKGAGSDEVAGATFTIEPRTTNSLGVSFRYTSLEAFAEGRAFLPGEFTLGYVRAVSGTPGTPAPRRAYVQLAIHHLLWGGGQE